MLHSYRSKRNTFCLFLHNSSECEVDGKCYWPTEVVSHPLSKWRCERNNPEEISVCYSDAATCNIWKKSTLFAKNIVILRYFWVNFTKVPFFKDSRCCPKILDYTLVCADNLKSVWYINVKIIQQLNW